MDLILFYYSLQKRSVHRELVLSDLDIQALQELDTIAQASGPMLYEPFTVVEVCHYHKAEQLYTLLNDRLRFLNRMDARLFLGETLLPSIPDLSWRLIVYPVSCTVPAPVECVPLRTYGFQTPIFVSAPELTDILTDTRACSSFLSCQDSARVLYELVIQSTRSKRIVMRPMKVPLLFGSVVKAFQFTPLVTMRIPVDPTEYEWRVIPTALYDRLRCTEPSSLALTSTSADTPPSLPKVLMKRNESRMRSRHIGVLRKSMLPKRSRLSSKTQ